MDYPPYPYIRDTPTNILTSTKAYFLLPGSPGTLPNTGYTDRFEGADDGTDQRGSDDRSHVLASDLGPLFAAHSYPTKLGGSGTNSFGEVKWETNTSQSATILTAFAPIRFTVTSFLYPPPQTFAGGKVFFRTPVGTNAPSCTFTPNPATIAADNTVTVTPIANGYVGSYQVTAMTQFHPPYDYSGSDILVLQLHNDGAPQVTVTNDADDGFGSLRWATRNVAGGGLITFDRDHTIHLGSVLDVNSSIDGGTNRTTRLLADNSVAFSNCNVQGAFPSGSWDATLGVNGGGNIATNPLFASAANSNFTLQAGSPCINVGHNGSVSTNSTKDLAGLPRISGGTVDMGAYETPYIVTVNFLGNGGTPATVSSNYVEGVAFGAFPSVARTGYTFAAWTNAAGGTMATTTLVARAVTNLYARWTANPYAVTLDKQSGTGGSNAANGAPGQTVINVASAAGFGVGDEALLLCLQGPGAGAYEFARVASAASGSLTLNAALRHTYDVTNGARVIVQRVPNYRAVTVKSNGVLTASAWTGGASTWTPGGVVAFRVNGTLTIEAGGYVTAAALGFAGGVGISSDASADGYQGESYTLTVGGQSREPNAGAGGAGLYYSNTGDGGGGGGGGGHGTAGMPGATVEPYHGLGGGSYGFTNMTAMYLDSGGGVEAGTMLGGAGGTGIVAFAQAEVGLWSDTFNRDTNFTAVMTVISNAAQLAQFAWLVNGGETYFGNTVTLANDIDLAAHYWVPAGPDFFVRFEGAFDGAGHAVRGLRINQPTTAYQGLFGNVGADGSVRNLTVTNVDIIGQYYVGGIAGRSFGTLSNCTVAAGGSVSGTSYSVGGVAGCAEGALFKCFNGADVTGDSAVGGVAGEANNTTTNCQNGGAVRAHGSVGGVAGIALGALSDCCNSGAVVSVSGEDAGGIAATAQGSLYRCINRGSVEGAARCGGITGDHAGERIEGCVNHGDISGTFAGGVAVNAQGLVINCLNHGQVLGLYAGGIVEDLYENGVVRNCANHGESLGFSSAGGVVRYVETGALLENCFSAGTVMGEAGKAGGLAYRNEGVVTGSYWKVTGVEPFNTPAVASNYATVAACESFGEAPVTLTYLAGPGGIIASQAVQVIAHGTDGEPVTVDPVDGATFLRWSDVRTDNPRRDEAVITNTAVTAQFESGASVPIDWYAEYGLTPGVGEDWSDVDARDPHGKGMTLSEEYVAMTDPANPTSVFRTVSLQRK